MPSTCDLTTLEAMLANTANDVAGPSVAAEFNRSAQLPASEATLQEQGNTIGGEAFALVEAGSRIHEACMRLSGSKAAGSRGDVQMFEVHVVSLEGLPSRAALRHQGPPAFAVRLRWPSVHGLGEAELTGLAAQSGGRAGHAGPGLYRGANVLVERALRLPWVEGQVYASLAVHELGPAGERLVGEALLPPGSQGAQRVAILSPHGSVEGYALVRLAACPSASSPRLRTGRRSRCVADATEEPWWSRLCLCSLAGPRV
mmetsp:Transcript_44390/g.128320  ORF Transcript_44390/g.128320 Transcript_44390/m.128320 type:complete len:258 (+) Transcript_44390:69-842(+)